MFDDWRLRVPYCKKILEQCSQTYVSSTRNIDLSGQESTQAFINRAAAGTTFFSLMPFDMVCLSFVTFMPFHDIRSRWEIELDFGHTRDFHTNINPHLPQVQQHENQNENQIQQL